MKKIEAIISPFVENQFPSFYQEEGPQFIAFAKAYFEWMENSGSYTAANGDIVTPYIDSSANISYTSNSSNKAIGPAALYQARKLPDYRDIDTTVDEFILQFKEKYLKNIQFDTATNKELLIKNSLDLYRSKGTERSIDLFFKLVYGTAAEVRYPADNILRVSDGIWERPEYLEVTHKRFNVDYVGKQIIGAISGAKAFVEKFIRRRTSVGYVDILYISGRQGEFTNGELLGLNVNNNPVYDRTKRAKLIGSVKRVILQDRSRDFKVGDIVTFTGTSNGLGGLARVESVSEATGIVDFIFIDGGYGYTLNSESIISEKVITLDSVVANTNSDQYFRLFEQAVEPIVNATFTGATANLTIGQTLSRYASNGQVSGSGKIVDIDQTGSNGTIMISHVNGVFTNTATYFTPGNVISFHANTVEDRTIGGKVMGIPQVYTLTLRNQNGTLAVNQSVLYKNTSAIVGRGTIQSITADGTGNTVVINNTRGAFPIGERLEVSTDSSISANVTAVSLTVGVYDIRKFISTLKYSTANNSELLHSNRIYRYDSAGKKIAEGLLLTVSHDAGTSSGNLTFVPIKGYFTETDTFYTGANTGRATVVTYTVANAGGDYIASEHARLFTQTTNTTAIPLTTSFGSGAQFNVGTLGDTEDIFIGTDLISANGVGTLDYDRVTLTVGSSSAFAVGDRVYQEVNKIAFNASSSVNATTGKITLPSASTLFNIGDIVRYQVAAGNTALNGLYNGDYYYVAATTATDVILSHPYRKFDQINSTNFSTFANNKVDEAGHYLYKLAHGTVFEKSTGVLRTKDNHNYFSVTGGTADVSTPANSNIIKYGATSTNTTIDTVAVYTTLNQANQVYSALPIAGAAFGFPKNPQGDSKNKIFTCLTFDKFTLGSIGALSGIDPGAGYNVDPYVLAYQPYISAFGRRDFIINISGATGVYAVGERVNQTLADLRYYDLKVDNGAYSDTFDEKLVTVNVDDEIQSGNDFILYVSNSSTFNTTDDVNSNTDFISITNANGIYPVNTYVRYYTNNGNTALSSLANNAFYYVAMSNSSGITLATSQGGANINLTQASNVATFNSNTNVQNSNDFITIATANTLFANGQQVRYITGAGNTAVTGLTNNALYYVRYANTTGLALSETAGGANVNITALDPGGVGHFLRYYNPAANGHTIVKYANEFANNQRVIYRTPAANTVIDGLANNTAYYIVNANMVGFKLSDARGGTVKAINAASASLESHTFSTIPGFLPGDRVYQSTTPVMNASVQSIFSNTTGDYVRVSGNTSTINVTSSNTLLSYSNPYVSANVSTASLYQITSTAKGIVKSANTTAVRVKRLSFENTFRPGSPPSVSLLLGEFSGAEAQITGVTEDLDLIYPIGLNAQIEANVITANGQITSLQVVDSGVGYSNSDVLQYTSADGARSGSIKIVVDGHGIGEGYYRSSKGFLSEDMYIHDGDYYQEYSYEILSKISVDRYADMFKKVMHTAGTKFFGSALVVEEDSVTVELSEIATGQEVKFNSASDVSTANETIDTDITPNPFANGDIVRYTTASGNVALEGTFGGFAFTATGSTFISRSNINTSNSTAFIYPIVIDDYVRYLNAGGGDPVGGLIDGNYYYVVFANASGFRLSSTIRGTPITVTPPSGFAGAHVVNRFNISNGASFFVAGTSGSTIKLSRFSNGASVINITANTTPDVDTSGHYLTKIIEE